MVSLCHLGHENFKASIIAKNTAQSAPGILRVYALCIDVLILSLVIWSNTLFCVVLLLPSGLGDAPIEAFTDFCKAESKCFRRKWIHKGSIKCTGKQKVGICELITVQPKWLLFLVYFFLVLKCRQPACMQYTYILHLHYVFYLVFLYKLWANDKLFLILGNTAENSWIIYFMRFSLAYLDACKLTS